MTLEGDVIARIRGLCYKYPSSEEFALKNINLDVRRGEFLVVAGRSGSGKSTLLYALNGIIPHAISGEMRGSVNVCGLDTRENEINVLATKVGMVFQNPEAQLFNVTVEDELAFIAENLCYPRDEIERCVDFALDAVGIRDLRTRYPFELSGGEKQRVVIASAISVKPEILVLDEPTADLDALGREMVLGTLKKLNEMGITIVIAEHDFDEIAKYTSRMIVLENGRIVADGDPRDVFLNRVVKNIGLRVPQTVEISLRMKGSTNTRSVPLTVEEALNCYKDDLSKIRISRKNDNPASAKHTKPAIEIENLSFGYRDVTVLENINLTINERELVALVGPNGSGKTTLAMVMVGLLKPKKGTVRIGGVDTRKTKRLHEKVGFLFQNPDYQLFCDTVESEIQYGLKNKNLKLVEEILETMDLKKYREKHPHTLSRGERQRVATATALARQPDILILDEPTSGMDWTYIKQLLNLILDLHSKGRTILLITHDMRVVAEYCQRVVVMNNGRIVLDGDTRTVLSKTLKQAHLKPPPITEISLRAGIHPPLIKVEEIGTRKPEKKPYATKQTQQN
ncbi:MAG: ABC transporter ATP-binding protein [Candidatus Freyrarchaeum guaymaensis]